MDFIGVDNFKRHGGTLILQGESWIKFKASNRVIKSKKFVMNIFFKTLSTNKRFQDTAGIVRGAFRVLQGFQANQGENNPGFDQNKTIFGNYGEKSRETQSNNPEKTEEKLNETAKEINNEKNMNLDPKMESKSSKTIKQSENLVKEKKSVDKETKNKKPDLEIKKSTLEAKITPEKQTKNTPKTQEKNTPDPTLSVIETDNIFLSPSTESNIFHF